MTRSRIVRAAFFAPALLLLGMGLAHAQSTDPLKDKGCTACHSPDAQTAGPSQASLAARFKAKDVPALAQRLRTSGFDGPGPALTVIHDVQRFSDAELQALVGLMIRR